MTRNDTLSQRYAGTRLSAAMTKLVEARVRRDFAAKKGGRLIRAGEGTYSGKMAATLNAIAGSASALTISPPERVKLVA